MSAKTRGEAGGRVRMCRAAGCARHADSGAVPGFCITDADEILTFRRFLGGHGEFLGHNGPLDFDAARVAWQRTTSGHDD